MVSLSSSNTHYKSSRDKYYAINYFTDNELSTRGACQPSQLQCLIKATKRHQLSKYEEPVIKSQGRKSTEAVSETKSKFKNLPKILQSKL